MSFTSNLESTLKRLPVAAWALFFIAVVAMVLIAVEFAGRTFTTELQVSQYVEVPLVGTLPNLEYLSRDVVHCQEKP